MAKFTGYQVKCRCGAWTPLKQQINDRYYYSHSGQIERFPDIQCTHHERFQKDVDNIEDLKSLYPDVEFRRTIAPTIRSVSGSDPARLRTVPITDTIHTVEENPYVAVQEEPKSSGQPSDGGWD